MAHKQSAKRTPRSKKSVSEDLLPPSSPPSENEEDDQKHLNESPLPPYPSPPLTSTEKSLKKKKKENESGKGKEIEEKVDRASASRMKWKVEDEIAILKGMSAFNASTGKNPSKHAEAFRDFMMESEYSLPEASIAQLKDKIRKIKWKFTHGLGGQEFKELAKNLWEPENNTMCEELEENQEQERRRNTKRKRVRSGGLEQEHEQEEESDDDLKGMIRNWSELLPGVSDEVLNKAFNSIDGSQRAEWMKRWKKHQIAEFELCVNKTELIKDLARLLWGAYKSLNNLDQ